MDSKDAKGILALNGYKKNKCCKKSRPMPLEKKLTPKRQRMSAQRCAPCLFVCRDKHARLLRALAWDTIQVRSFCNAFPIKVFERERRFMSGYDLQKYTNGASKEGINLHSQTIQQFKRHRPWTDRVRSGQRRHRRRGAAVLSWNGRKDGSRPACKQERSGQGNPCRDREPSKRLSPQAQHQANQEPWSALRRQRECLSACENEPGQIGSGRGLECIPDHAAVQMRSRRRVIRRDPPSLFNPDLQLVKSALPQRPGGFARLLWLHMPAVPRPCAPGTELPLKNLH